MDAKEKKQQAVLAAAAAYYDRAPFLQYDQRSMDRALQLTPRRQKFLPPEASNSQHIHFLDCSSYVTAIYLTAFGYELPSDLTWLMIDAMEPRVYYYELTHQETIAEIRTIFSQLRALLEPGDLITYDRGVGAGHVVMYLGDNMYTDCTVPEGEKNSYNYAECKNQLYDRATWYKSLDRMLPPEDEKLYEGRSLFNPNVGRFSVHRPLEIVGDILPQMKIRMAQAKDLWCAVENSAPGCLQAYPGRNVEYTVIVRNCSQEGKTVTIRFDNPVGTTFAGEAMVTRQIKAEEELRVSFVVTVEENYSGIRLDGPSVIVNDLQVYAHPVLLGKAMEADAWTRISTLALEELHAGATAMEAAEKAYGAFGIKLDTKEKYVIHKLFFCHDSPVGSMLTRRLQKPFEDLAVYSAFGGKGVSTPELMDVPGIRLTHITRKDLLPGDVLVCADDALGNGVYSAFYTGEALIGRFCADDETRALTVSETDRFIDSLFGRFAFVLLRPWQGKR